MPFDFLKRKKAPDAANPPAAPSADKTKGVAFDGLTEDWRLTGQMMIEGRLSDALNKREPIELLDVQWGPVDGSEPMVDAPGLKTVDPYDLVIVVAGERFAPGDVRGWARGPPRPQGLVRGRDRGAALSGSSGRSTCYPGRNPTAC